MDKSLEEQGRDAAVNKELQERREKRKEEAGESSSNNSEDNQK